MSAGEEEEYVAECCSGESAVWEGEAGTVEVSLLRIDACECFYGGVGPGASVWVDGGEFGWCEEVECVGGVGVEYGFGESGLEECVSWVGAVGGQVVVEEDVD